MVLDDPGIAMEELKTSNHRNGKKYNHEDPEPQERWGGVDAGSLGHTQGEESRHACTSTLSTIPVAQSFSTPE